MPDGEPVPGSIYVYAPNKGAPVFFIVAYGISAIGHIYQCYRFKSWGLIGLQPFCAVFFTAGYALREYGAYNYMWYDTSSLIIYIMSQVFIYMCPPLLELCNYHVLGRILYYVPYFAPIPPGRVLAIFGGLMAVVETLNALGVALSSNKNGTNQDLGRQMTLAALSLQLVVIISFVFIAGIFHKRCSRAGIRTKAVTIPIYTMYASMTLIFVRCIYRLIENVGNTTVHLEDIDSLRTLSPILRYEWFFYVFEATLMLINSAIWNIWNPGKLLPRNHDVHLDRDGVTEIQPEGHTKDRMPWWVVVASIVTFGLAAALYRDQQKKQRREHGELNNSHRSGTTDGPAPDRSKERVPLWVIVGSVLTFGLLYVVYRSGNKEQHRDFEELNTLDRGGNNHGLGAQGGPPQAQNELCQQRSTKEGIETDSMRRAGGEA